MLTDEREFTGPRSDWPLWFQIAIGVAVGVLVANAIEWGIARYYFATQLSEASFQMRQAAERAQAEAARVAAQVAAQEEARRQSQAAERDARAQAAAEQQRAEEAVRQSAAAEAQRHDDAWRKFYRPSPGCVGSTVSVECANEYARAKKDFASKLAAGQI